MATIASLVQDFTGLERPIGVLISDETVKALCIAAVRFFAGYDPLRSTVKAAEEAGQEFDPGDRAQTALAEITEDTEIDASEWALIRPLFLLYLERETALQLEASRGMGVDPFGRSSSEIAQDIAQKEAAMSHDAFCEEVITV